MVKKDTTAALIDGVLKLFLATGSMSIVIFMPTMAQVLEKPVIAALNKLDKRDQERELRRVLRYMKSQGLIRGEYDHGLKITKKGRKRLKATNIANLEIKRPNKWDKKWRIVIYDIPEKYKSGRDALTTKLKSLGFYQLQRSVWVHPYPCREEIMLITAHFVINQYVSYIETDHIDQEKSLIRKFSML